MESLLSGVPLWHLQYLSKPALDDLTRDRARVHQADDALSVDEHGRRHAAERVALADLALLVEQYRERHLELVHELPHVLHVLLIRQVDRQHLQPLILVRFVRGDDVAHLAAARCAPRSPEIEEQGMTLVIGQSYRAAGERFQRELRRRCSWAVGLG